MSNRWRINRLGLINFWYYDDEEFELSDGKLLLRGSNGSGKSVTMQSFIPLLFDGNKSPERLDPFGTRSRRLENYLLDEATEEKTAYLYIEFRRSNSDTYITLGMGLRAQKSKPIDSWYFIINDGKRVNKDIYLYKNYEEKVPLSKRQLQNELGSANFFTESQQRYMAKVNEVLFGYEELEGYEELLNLLIQLRSPKLSKDFKPTEIYNILTNSLKLLSEDDLRPMSESMENMDQLQNSLEEKDRALRAVNNIKYYYDKYNRFCLSEKTKAYDNAYKEAGLKKRKIEGLLEEEKSLNEEYNSIRLTVGTLKEELKYANEKYESLRNNDAYKLKERLQRLNEDVQELKVELNQKEKQLEAKNQDRKAKEWQHRDIGNQLDAYVEKARIKLKELAELGQSFSFNEGEYLEKEVMGNIESYDFSYIDACLQKYTGRIKEAKKILKEFEAVNESFNKLQQISDSLTQQKDIKEGDLAKSSTMLTEVKEEVKEKYNNWADKNIFCKLEKATLHEVFRLVNQVDGGIESSDLLSLDRPVTEAFNIIKAEKTTTLKFTERAVTELENNIDAVRVEIKELMLQKDIEPIREDGIIQNRQRLTDSNIPYIPLYKAIDFDKSVPDGTRKSIESALNEIGILDAIIINPKDKEKALSFPEKQWDKYLFINGNMMRHNLTSYCKVNKEELNGVSGDAVYEILQGIYLDDDNLCSLDEKGNYTFGALKGKASENYEPKYIGILARKKHREQLVEQKNTQISGYQQQIDALYKNILSTISDIKRLDEEYRLRPSFVDMQQSINIIQANVRDIIKLEGDIIKADEELFRTRTELVGLKTRLYEAAQGISINKTLLDFEAAEEAAGDFRDELTNAKLLQGNIKKAIESIRVLEEGIEAVAQDIDNIYADISSKRNKQRKCELEGSALQDTLKTMDIGTIEKDIESCIAVINNNPQKLENLIKRNGEVENSIKGILQKLRESREELLIKEEMLNTAQSIFMEEISLKYVISEIDGTPISLLKATMRAIVEEDPKNKSDYLQKLIEAHHKNSGDLRDFNTKIISLFEETEARNRIDISCRAQGKDMTLNALGEVIKTDIDELKLLISAEERRIFEEVLLNTISSKISAKIYLSRQWVDKINDLMESMNTSSSLALSLKWIPQKSEREEQLDIAELLEVLERSGRVNEEDMRKLASHFGDKVKEAIRSYEENSESRNYHSIIKDVLDYRKWFEFKLFYTKKNEKKKELTNNAFFQFSGGEKAMSMYIPLFSAVYARYENARKDCPRIISLDEAFAGVDENNIRDMFRLLKELKLDYLLNSQILWGDYDTVDDLSICELIREENDDVVTVIRYHWNGIEKKCLV